MASPTGILPESLMFPAKLAEVMDFLIKLPIPGEEKERIFFGWAKTVGVKVSGSMYRKLRASGVE